MDCATFERELAELMAGDGIDRAERPRRLERLEAHRAACEHCAACGDLLALLGRPEAERDLVTPPPAKYWDDFNARLAERIEAEDAWPSRRGRLWLASAAAIVLLVVAGGLLRELLRTPDPAPPDAAAATVAGDDAAPWSELVTEALDAAPDDEAWLAGTDGMRWSSWWDGPAPDEAPGGELFPDVTDLDAGARLELLRWLERESS